MCTVSKLYKSVMHTWIGVKEESYFKAVSFEASSKDGAFLMVQSDTANCPSECDGEDYDVLNLDHTTRT